MPLNSIFHLLDGASSVPICTTWRKTKYDQNAINLWLVFYDYKRRIADTAPHLRIGILIITSNSEFSTNYCISLLHPKIRYTKQCNMAFVSTHFQREAKQNFATRLYHSFHTYRAKTIFILTSVHLRPEWLQHQSRKLVRIPHTIE